MVDDPYKVLGLSPGATQDEIKRAYRKKAKENHPDLHPGDKEAEKRMHEINEAYDMLMNPDKYAQRRAQQQQQQRSSYGPYGAYGGYGQQSYGGQQSGPYGQQHSSQGGYGGWNSDFFGFDDFFGFGGFTGQVPPPQAEPGDSPVIRQIVQDIHQRQFQAAITRLQNIVSTSRDARWYYLSGIANYGAGNQVTAVEHMRRAVQMNPNNRTYQALLQQYRQAGQTYEHHAQGYHMGAMDPSKLCMGFCLMNFLCRFCWFC